MSQSVSRIFARLVPFLVVALVALATPTPAAANTHCFAELEACYGRAAGIDGFWSRTAAALDCEIDLVVCLEHALEK